MSRALRTTVVDSSAWIGWFRDGQGRLRALLAAGRVFVHPWVLYELELGSGIPKADRELLHRLPRVGTLSDEEAWRTAQVLLGRGLGWVDVHLLTATRDAGFALMTLDRALASGARRLGIPVTT